MALFSDPFSDTNPTIIGLGIGLLVLVGFGVLFLFVLDERFIGWEKDPEALVRQQAREIDDLKERIALDKSTIKQKTKEKTRLVKISRQFESAKRRLALAEKQLAETLDKKNSLEQEITSITEESAAYKNHYRRIERAKAKGEKYKTLELKDGRVLKDVTVTAVDAVRMQVRHRGGISGIPWRKLPDAMQDRFQFDEHETQTQIGTERANNKMRGLANEAAKTSKSIHAKTTQINRNKAAILALRSKIKALGDKARRLPNEIERKHREIAAEQSKPLRHTEKLVNELNQLKRQQNAIPGQIKQLSINAAKLENETKRLEAEIAEMKDKLAGLRLKLEEKRKNEERQ